MAPEQKKYFPGSIDRKPSRRVLDALLREETIIPTVRDQVFTPELKKIAGEIINHSKIEIENSFIPHIDEIFAASSSPFPYQITKMLLDLMEKDSLQQEDFSDVFMNLLHKTGARSLALLLLDPFTLTYKTYLHYGLDPVTLKNLYFGIEDIFLDKNEIITQLDFRSNLKDTYHFRKRFSTYFYLNHKMCVVHSLRPYKMPGLFIYFYDHDAEEQHPDFLNFFKILIPIFQRYYEDTVPTSMLAYTKSLNDTIYHYLRKQLHIGSEWFHAIYLEMNELLDHSAWKTMLHQIAGTLQNALSDDDRILILSPGKLLILLSSSNPFDFIAYAEEAANKWDIKLSCRKLTYPDDFKNLYNFITLKQ